MEKPSTNVIIIDVQPWKHMSFTIFGNGIRAPSVASLVKASILFHIMDYCNCVMSRWKFGLNLPKLKFYTKVLHIEEKKNRSVTRHCKRTEL